MLVPGHSHFAEHTSASELLAWLCSPMSDEPKCQSEISFIVPVFADETVRLHILTVDIHFGLIWQHLDSAHTICMWIIAVKTWQETSVEIVDVNLIYLRRSSWFSIHG